MAKFIFQVAKKMKVQRRLNTDELEKRDLANYGFAPNTIIGEGQYARVYTGTLKPFASVLFDQPHLKKYIAKEVHTLSSRNLFNS